MAWQEDVMQSGDVYLAFAAKLREILEALQSGVQELEVFDNVHDETVRRW